MPIGKRPLTFPLLFHRKVAQDAEFALYTVTIFRRVRDEFTQKCRDEKFTVREFVYDEAAVEKQNRELSELEASEKELWVSKGFYKYKNCISASDNSSMKSLKSPLCHRPTCYECRESISQKRTLSSFISRSSIHT